MKRISVFAITALICVSFFVSCSGENGKAGFPDFMKGKSFSLKASSRSGDSLQSDDYYILTTGEDSVTIDALLGSLLTSYEEGVNVLLTNGEYTAEANSGAVYTFSVDGNSVKEIRVEGAGNTSLCGSYTVSTLDKPALWTTGIEKFEGESVAGGGLMRLMFTPAGVFFAVTYEQYDGTFSWDYIKDANFFPYTTVIETEDGYKLEGSTRYSSVGALTLKKESGGWKVFFDTGAGESDNFTHHVKNAGFDPAFFFSVQMNIFYRTES